MLEKREEHSRPNQQIQQTDERVARGQQRMQGTPETLKHKKEIEPMDKGQMEQRREERQCTHQKHQKHRY